MIETLRWWLAATVIGVIAVPYAFRLFRFLPDRGYTVARILGVLLTVYAMWALSVIGLAPFTAGTAVLLLGLLAAGAAVLAGRDRAALADHFDRNAKLIVAAEVVFALFLFGTAAFRAYAPQIDATEKPFEFAFFNAVLRSDHMPAADPWYGGQPMSYYYGGYLVVALFTKLTGTVPSIAFNLGVALTAGLTALAAFGLGANLVLALRGRPRHAGLAMGNGAAIAGGAISVVLLMLLGNLLGVFDLASAQGWGSAELYRRLGIEGLSGPGSSAHWYPDGNWFWWRATRLGSGWNIFEFPFFSFMLGDLHAHVMVLPFTVLGFTAILNLLRSGTDLVGRPARELRHASDYAWLFIEALRDALRRTPLIVAFLGVLAGMLALANSWDQPIFLLLLFAAVVVLDIERNGLTLRAVVRALAFVAPVVVLSVLFYVPFFVYLHPATNGIAPVELNNLPAGVPGEAMVFPPHHLLIFWGPLLLVGGCGIVLQAVRRRVLRSPSAALLTAAVITLAPLVLWATVITGIHRSPAVFEEIGVRAEWWAFGSYWLVQGALLVLVALGILTLLAEARRPVEARRDGRLFLLLAATSAIFLIHVIELFYVKEPTPARTNTIFKFSYTAWLLLSCSGGAAIVDALSAWKRRDSTSVILALWTAVMGMLGLVAWFGDRRVLPIPIVWAVGVAIVYFLSPRGQRRFSPALPVWVGATALVLLLAFIYPVTAAMNRTDGFTAQTTLDGLAYLQTIDPDELAAAQWMNANLPGKPVVLEAVGGDYSSGGRVSGRTGFPTVLGWPFHEAQERGGADYPGQQATVAAREHDVETIYKTLDPEQASALLKSYGISYVYVGRMEMDKYGVDGVAKFDVVGHAVYRQGAVTIYAVGGQPALAAWQ